MNANESNRRNSYESDYEHGDEVVVNDMPDWQHPFTVSVVYHSGALKVLDKDGAWYHVAADEVDDVVSPVNDGKELVTDGDVDTLASIESERTRDDYVDIEEVFEDIDEGRELMVRQKDNGSERFLKGEYGEFIHRDDEPCEDAPERPILRFDVKRGSGAADLCPDCDWPDWVIELQKEKEKERERVKEVFA